MPLKSSFYRYKMDIILFLPLTEEKKIVGINVVRFNTKQDILIRNLDSLSCQIA